MPDSNLEESIEHFRNFDLDGGQLALDFANTIDWRNTQKEQEWLESYTDLAAWGLRTGVLDNEAAAVLARLADKDPSEAEIVLQQARDLRELLFRIFNAVIQEQLPDSEDWQRFNRMMGVTMSRAAIGREGKRFFWTFDRERHQLDYYLGPVLKAAADLLIEGNLSRLKRCCTPECQWLFLDTSKNNSRRWCDMRSCGNRAKAKTYYRKKRSSSAKG